MRKQYITFFWLLVLIHFQTFAFQSPDSLNKKERIDAYVTEAKKLFSSDPINSTKYASDAAKLAMEIQDTSGHAMAIKLLGNINYMLGNYTDALSYFLDSYQLHERLGDTLSMAGLQGSIGLVFKATEEYDKSLSSYEKAHALLQNSDNAGIKAKLFNNQGVIYRRLGNHEIAEEYFQRSLRIKKEIADKKGVANSYTNLGNVNVDKQDYEKAMAYFEQSLVLEEELQSEEGIAMNINNIANLHFLLGDHREAIKFATRGLEIGEKLRTKIQIKEASHILAKANYALGNYERAYGFFEQFHAVNDSLFNEEEARKIGRLESKLELIEKQKELDQLEKTNTINLIELKQKRTQQLFIVVISLLMVSILAYIIITQKQKSRLRENALQAELSELRVEIKTLIGKYEGSLDISLLELNARLVTPLSEREFDVFKKIFSQKTNSEIANELFVSINTVKTHLKNLYTKLGVSNRKEALDTVLNA